eukprot:693864-Prymnesium_polylepis.1
MLGARGRRSDAHMRRIAHAPHHTCTCTCAADPTFNPKRAPVIVPKRGDEGPGGVGLVYTPDAKEEINAAAVAPE